MSNSAGRRVGGFVGLVIAGMVFTIIGWALLPLLLTIVFAWVKNELIAGILFQYVVATIVEFVVGGTFMGYVTGWIMVGDWITNEKKVVPDA
jgi:hypothetical protein